MSLRRAVRAACCLPAALVASCATAHAVFAPPPPPAPTEPPGVERGAFVVRVGSDTVAVEQFTRTADRIEARQVVRTPRVQLREYAANLAPDGALSRVTLTVRDPGRVEPISTSVIEYRSVDALVERTLDGRTTTQSVPVRAGAIPELDYAIGLYDALLRWFWPRPASSVETNLVRPGDPEPAPLVVRRAGPDRAIVATPAGEVRARVAPDGRILEWNGTGATPSVVADRVGPVDFEALAASYAGRDAAGQGIGVLAPPDSLRVTVAGAKIAIDYGRPAMRGRVVFGNLVPWGRVWRTGVGMPTTLRTSRALTIAGKSVPAGVYTLWTLPTPTAWTLILSRETSDAAEYDPSQDQARIGMVREALPNPLERLTIGIDVGVDPQADGTLWLGWADTRASVPFSVARRGR